MPHNNKYTKVVVPFAIGNQQVFEQVGAQWDVKEWKCKAFGFCCTNGLRYSCW
jgi:hypothetical protein